MAVLSFDPAEAGELAEEPAEQLAAEMAAAWRSGSFVNVEEVLAAHPELADYPDAAVRLIYEEMCLREEFGQAAATAEIVRRFPHLRERLDDFLSCYRLLHRREDAARFPEVGDTLGEFRLLAELGRGRLGRVYLATQPALADRPLVLKVTPGAGTEHLSLARLQHTHIVPLYWVSHFPERNLRALCMPYLGGVTLERLLAAHAGPVTQRTGRYLLDVLEASRSTHSVALPVKGPALAFLARATYVRAVSWVAACLADALQYAHERGLVHLDLKPSNVLLAADGQPMILDFHLSRRPLQPDEPAPDWFGGTPGYMSPEQRSALLALGEGRPIPSSVDGRSDIYSLGMLLYEALGGTAPDPTGVPIRLERRNRCVSRGLADIVHKCLSPKPECRYQEAAALADDLRRHLADLLLRGVANCDWLERGRKWRRRHPHAPAILGMLAAVLLVVMVALSIAFGDMRQRRHDAESALADGEQQMRSRQFSEAVHTFYRGLASAERLPGGDDLRQRLQRRLCLARRAEGAQFLHAVADRLRFCYGNDSLARPQLRMLEADCRREWDRWTAGARNGEGKLEPEAERDLALDLLDLAVLWADLHVRVAAGDEVEPARRDALRLLAEAEALLGPSIVLLRERQAHAEALGMKGLAAEAARQAAGLAPRTPWEHYALGRALLRDDRLALAADEFDRALDDEPQNFWAEFYRGLCAYRLEQYDDAAAAFHACVTLAPRRAECYYNRGLAYAQLGERQRALRDFDRALQLDARLAAAALNRGMLHYQEHRYADAAADLRRALDDGADPALVHYNLALVSLAQKDRDAARSHLVQALSADPQYGPARELLDQLPHPPENRNSPRK
jgi:serine/threonine protein kinase/Flp pilus assembly protein TadD